MTEKEEKPSNDHRDIGQKLDLFSFHDVAPGAPFLHPKGMAIFRELEKYARKVNDQRGFLETSTPILVKTELFEKSGHWEHYRDNMFWFANPRDENERLAIKPMNCPESALIYSSDIRSWRDLPMRLAEIGRLHRNELSGTLGGLLRVRQITMDDAHIYASPEQVENEVVDVLETIGEFYSLFGFKPRYVLATKPKKSLGTAEEWKEAEDKLASALKKFGTKYEVAEGEGAFYGPKIEVHMKDSQGREWQMGTAQLDIFMLPKRFDLGYTDSDGSRKMPWVIHRAIFGSFERFIGMLLEETGGALPFWLSPVQIAVLTINDKVLEYAKEISEKLRNANFRAELDTRNETINKKIREAELQKIPYILVIGEKEKSSGLVNVRERGIKEQKTLKLDDFIKEISKKLEK